MSIDEKQDRIIKDFNELDDWFMQYSYLIELTSEMDEINESEKTEKTRVAGCQSNVWLILEYDGHGIKVKAESDSLIIKGILGIIVHLFDNQTPDEIKETNVNFIEQTALKHQLSTDRLNGMTTVINQIKDFAEKNSSIEER